MSGQRLLLKGGRVVDPAAGRDGEFDILIEGDRVARIEVRELTALSRSTSRLCTS